MNDLPLILDTNLLVLYVVGTASRAYISKHKRLTEFIEPDYDTLLKIIEHAPVVLVTPNTLTETSNLAAHISEPARGDIFQVLQQLIETSKELHLASASVVGHPDFIRLGLTDAVLLDANNSQAALLTTDLKLYQAALGRGSPAFNFNHLRDEYLR